MCVRWRFQRSKSVNFLEMFVQRDCVLGRCSHFFVGSRQAHMDSGMTISM